MDVADIELRRVLPEQGAIDLEVRTRAGSEELRQISRWHAPTGHLPVKNQQRRVGRTGTDAQVLDDKITVHNGARPTSKVSFQLAPVRFDHFALRRQAPQQRHLLSGQGGIINVRQQRGPGGTQQLQVVARSVIGQQRLKVGGNPCTVNRRQPTSGQRAMFFVGRRVSVRAGVLQEQPDELALRLRHKPMAT